MHEAYLALEKGSTLTHHHADAAATAFEDDERSPELAFLYSYVFCTKLTYSISFWGPLEGSGVMQQQQHSRRKG
jgi:hypothetical protein